ncbi:hypothetical protein LTR85_001556 [Meristemomyces frigidus]|nr:hypothetical protein LTR85_001556 [Meristemomyces frigidus]
MHQSPSLASAKLIRSLMDEAFPIVLRQPLLETSKEAIVVPLLDCDAFPNLELKQGYGCNYCPYMCKTLLEIQGYYNAHHALVRRGRGGSKPSAKGAPHEKLDQEHYRNTLPWHEAAYQRFLGRGLGAGVFRVRTVAQKRQEDADRERERHAHVLSEADFVAT